MGRESGVVGNPLVLWWGLLSEVRLFLELLVCGIVHGGRTCWVGSGRLLLGSGGVVRLYGVRCGIVHGVVIY